MTAAPLIVAAFVLVAAFAVLVTVELRGRRPRVNERRRVVVHTRDAVSIRGWENARAHRDPVVVLHDAEYLEATPAHTVGTVEIPASNVGWVQIIAGESSA